jgi:hypothetical protein
VTTVQEALDRRRGRWVLWVEIAGLGIANGIYKWSTGVPDYAAGDPTWLPVLEGVPRELTEDVDRDGGIVNAGVLSFTLVDRDDVVSDLLRFDADPVGELLQAGIDDTDASFIVRNGTPFAVDDVIHLDHEAMIVTAVTPGTPGSLTVTRGELGTEAQAHAQFTAIRGWVPKLHGRVVTFYLAPADAASYADKLELGEYSVAKVGWTVDWTGWRISCASTVLALKRRVGDGLQESYRAIVAFDDGRTFSLEAVGHTRRNFERNVWGIRDYYLLNGRELVLAAGYVHANQIVIEQRGLAGTQQVDLQQAMADGGFTVHRPLVANTDDGVGAFRYIPTTAADQEDRDDPAVVQSDHWVDIALCLMTSSRRAEDGLELVNYESGFPNWSTLPVGMGAGIKAARIDFAAWLVLRYRTPNWRFPRLWLTEPTQLGKLLVEQFLRALGVFLVSVNGKIRPVLPQLPYSGLGAFAFDHGNLLAEPRPLARPLISGGFDESGSRKAVVLKPRNAAGEPVTIVIAAPDLGQDDEPTSEDVLEIDLPGVSTGQAGVTAFLEELAIRRLWRTARPPPALDVQVDLEALGVTLGNLVGVTFDAAPNPQLGGRGWDNVTMTVVGRALDLDLQAPGLRFQLLGYGGRLEVGRVAPSAKITGWNAGTSTATVAANRYTDPDGAILGLPVSDAEAFLAGAVVKVIDEDGTDAHSSTQLVTADGASNQIVLDGNWGVTDPTGLIIVLADYDAARTEEQVRYAAYADGTNKTVGASSRKAWAYGEQ